VATLALCFVDLLIQIELLSLPLVHRCQSQALLRLIWFRFVSSSFDVGFKRLFCFLLRLPFLLQLSELLLSEDTLHTQLVLRRSRHLMLGLESTFAECGLRSFCRFAFWHLFLFFIFIRK